MAGASAVGARQFLIAYNLYLDAAEPPAHTAGALPQSAQAGIAAARAIARAIRASTGGMPGVKAIGVMVNGRAQLSMNITDFSRTPMHSIRAVIGELVRNHRAVVTEAELIGLIPQDAYDPAAEWLREIPGFDPAAKVLERRLEHPLPWPGDLRSS